MVLDLLSGNFRNLFAVKNVGIDDKWDQMNRNYTVMFCILSGTIMTLKQNLGTVIQCIGDFKRDISSSFPEMNPEFVTDYCSSQGLFTLKEAYSISWPDTVPYPGIIPFKGTGCIPGFHYLNGTPISCPDPKDVKPYTEVHHVWYMFVPFYFCIVGIAFYFPYTVFRHFSGIYDVKPMLNGLGSHDEARTEEEISRKVDSLSRWLFIKLDPYMNSPQPYTQLVHKHSMFYTVVLVKIMYLATSILVFFWTHRIFEQGDFLWYGYDWIMSSASGLDYQVMDKLFPKMVACEIRLWGTTGLTKESLLCVLPQNVGNQYFFLIFWLILCVLVLSNGLGLIVTVFRFIFVTASYKRLLVTGLLRDEERYHMVFTHVGTTGRCILQLCAQHSSPKIFEDLMEIVCSLLIANYHKQIRKRTRRLGLVDHDNRGLINGSATVV